METKDPAPRRKLPFRPRRTQRQMLVHKLGSLGIDGLVDLAVEFQQQYPRQSRFLLEVLRTPDSYKDLSHGEHE